MIYGELDYLASLAEGLQPLSTAEEKVRQFELRFEASRAVTRIQRSLDNLPAYYMTSDWGELSLQKQHRRSELFLSCLLYGTGTVMAFSGVMLICGCAGFPFLCVPLRKAARESRTVTRDFD